MHDDHAHSPKLIALVVIGMPLGLAGWVALWWLIGVLIEFVRRRYGT